jgi:hypothetical protein
VQCFFFCFGGGRPLHKAQSLIFCIPLASLNARLTNSSRKAFLSSSYDVLSILRHSSRIIPELFIRLLPYSCCFRSRSLMPSLHSRPFQRLIPDVHSSSQCYIVLVISLAIVSPALCHFCMVHHLSVCDGQFLP